MKEIKAKDLKVGMTLTGWGDVVEVGQAENGYIDITFSEYDPECGEVEYFPCTLYVEETLEV